MINSLFIVKVVIVVVVISIHLDIVFVVIDIDIILEVSESRGNRLIALTGSYLTSSKDRWTIASIAVDISVGQRSTRTSSAYSGVSV